MLKDSDLARADLKRLCERYAYQTRHGTDAAADLVLDELMAYRRSVAAETREKALEEAAAKVEELRRTEGIGLDASYFARSIRALAGKEET